jgi:hypothetical protein
MDRGLSPLGLPTLIWPGSAVRSEPNKATPRGTRELMLRLPARLLDLDTAQQYCITDSADAWTSGGNVTIVLGRQDEDGDWDDEGGAGWLASIIGARADLAAGDLRLLYLAWLNGVWELDDESEPPVPANLATLNAPLRSLVDFIHLERRSGRP